MLGRLGQPVEHGHMDIMRETLYFHHHVSWHCYSDLSKEYLAHLWCHPHFVHASAAEGIFRVYLTCLITEFWQELLLQRSWCVHILLDVHACQAKADLDRKISKMAPQVHFFFFILQASWSLHVQGGKANFAGSVFFEYLTYFWGWDHQTSYGHSVKPNRSDHTQNVQPSLNAASVEAKIQIWVELWIWWYCSLTIENL